MRLRRPIAFILSAAVAASALTGCNSFSGHAAAAANSAHVQQLIEFIADLGLERDLRQALQSGGDLRQTLLTLLGLESAVNFNVDDLAGARPGQHAVQVWEVTAQSAEDAAALAAAQIRAVLEQLKSNGVTAGRIGMVEVDGKYYVVVDVEVTEENTFEPAKPVSDDDDDEEQQPQEPKATLESDKLTITGGSGTLDADTISELLDSSDWKSTVKTVDLSRSGYTQIGKPDDYYGVFQECRQLTEVTLPESLESIGSLAFAGCESLTSINLSDCTSLESIGYWAFDSCTSLASIDLSDCTSLESIGDGAFAKSGLTSINLSGCKNLTSIGNGAFQNCAILETITLPAGLITIGNSAFQKCTSLGTITLPSTVTTIGNSAFWNCGGLTSITLPAGLQNIGNSAFRDCSSLEEINLSDCTRLESIGNSAFNQCSGLKTVKLPAKLTTIGNYAFYNCSGLENIYFYGVPTTIEYNAFEGVNVEGLTIHCPSGKTNDLKEKLKASGLDLTDEHFKEGLTSLPYLLDF